jgi:hypothetical protein
LKLDDVVTAHFLEFLTLGKRRNFMACQPLSITLAVLAPDNKKQISFGLTKGCNPDDTAFWIIDFIFRNRPDQNSDFQDRVKLHVAVNAKDSAAAARLAQEGLTSMDIAFLSGPITNRAKKLPAGTASDPKLANMVTALVGQHA